MKCAQAYAGASRECIELVVVPGARPEGVDQQGETGSLVLPRHGRGDKLRLASIAVRRNDQPARNAIGRLRYEVPADQV